MIDEPGPTEVNTTGPLDDFLCFSVYSAGLAFSRVYKPLLDRFGITYPQYLVLLALTEQKDRTVSELGNRLFLESNTLTPLIKRLESAGLVTRTRDRADERVVRVNLTPQGSSVVREALSCVPASILDATGLSKEELAVLNDSLTNLGRVLRNSA